jgi:hypothetical protein
MKKIILVRIETTHHETETDMKTKWEETVNAIKRAATEFFYRAEVTVDVFDVD